MNEQKPHPMTNAPSAAPATPSSPAPGALSDAEIAERLRAARERREKLDAPAERAAKLRELERLEVQEKLEAECGPLGSAFAIHESHEGIIAVRLGPGILHKRFRESKMKDADVHDFVTPCVAHPEKEKFLEVTARRPGIMVELANMLVDLYSARSEKTAGKA